MPGHETRTNSRGQRSRVPVRFLIAGGTVALVLLLWGGLWDSDGTPDWAEPSPIELAATPNRAASMSRTAPESAVVSSAGIPHGTLAERESVPDLCSPEAWAGVAGIMREVGRSEIVVDRDTWEHRTLQTRVGLASWFSQCVFSGGPVVIRDAAGEQLAGYDSAKGFKLGG